MTHPSKPVTLVLATRNAHKAEEIRAILGAGVQCLTLADFPDAPPVVEDASTFAGNAIKKAVERARWLSGRNTLTQGTTFVLADDSGLEVDALNGAPGVHSARFAALDTETAGNSSDSANNEKLLRLLSAVPPEKRAARFRCVLALTPVMTVEAESASPVCYADAFEIETQTFEGTCEGSIDFAPRGRGGFGYDPLFIPTGFDQSFAELGEEIKNGISHRSKALTALKSALCA